MEELGVVRTALQGQLETGWVRETTPATDHSVVVSIIEMTLVTAEVTAMVVLITTIMTEREIPTSEAEVLTSTRPVARK